MKPQGYAIPEPVIVGPPRFIDMSAAPPPPVQGLPVRSKILRWFRYCNLIDESFSLKRFGQSLKEKILVCISAAGFVWMAALMTLALTVFDNLIIEIAFAAITIMTNYVILRRILLIILCRRTMLLHQIWAERRPVRRYFWLYSLINLMLFKIYYLLAIIDTILQKRWCHIEGNLDLCLSIRCINARTCPPHPRQHSRPGLPWSRRLTTSCAQTMYAYASVI